MRFCNGYALLLIALLAASPGVAAPIWFTNDRFTEQATELARSMQNAQRFGLVPADYPVASLAMPIANESARRQAGQLFTAAAAQFIKDLHSGRVDPQAAGFHFPTPARPFDVNRALEQLSTSPDVVGALKSYQPHARPYWLLIDALARYRQLAQNADLTRLPPLPQPKLTTGMAYEGTPALRGLLQALGDLDEEAPDEESLIFDAALEAALKKFQIRNGLAADGILGRQTYAALMTPLSVRVRQIELALERWRWTNLLERPDIVVNVPQFMLYALPKVGDAQSAVLEMPVIVGQSAKDRQTPIFTAQLKRVIFQPYWDVPYSILHKELLPLIRKDASYLEKHDMEIVAGDRDDSRVLPNTAESINALASGKARLRQRPGPQNALGPVKFVLPNAYNVYLHGTPEKSLFANARRDFSHGCVRVSDPEALAQYVLKNAAEPWDPIAIQKAMCGTQQIRVDLETPLRVMFFYSTAAATQSQGVLFADDLYGEDAKLEALLRARTHHSENSSR